MAKKRGDLLSDIKQSKDALIASERRGRKAVQRLRGIEKIFETLIPKMRNWSDLPVADESIARCLTTGECRRIIKALEAPESDIEPTEDKASA